MFSTKFRRGRRNPLLLGIHANPPWQLAWTYRLLPFAIAIIFYHIVSTLYLIDNPHGKIMPSFSMMAVRMWNLAFTYDTSRETYLLWADTTTSLIRFGAGLLLASLCGLLLGMNMALFPGMRHIMLPFVTALSFVPTPAVLPLLLIYLGIGEEAKIALIFLGLVFYITRDIYAKTMEIPQELLVKARTLDATELELVYTIVLPMIMPGLFESVRQMLGSAWIFLIVGEGIAASQGLGYRIFLARRTSDYTAVLPYVIWITLLASIVYYLMMWAQRRLYPWKQ